MDYNGNDAMGLFNNGNLIDIVGEFGNGTTFAEDIVLRRKPDATVPKSTNYDQTGDWNAFPQNDYSDLGSHQVATASASDQNFSDLRVYPNPSLDYHLQVDPL